MTHQQHMQDEDAVPPARASADRVSASGGGAENDAAPMRYLAPIRHAVPAAPPAYALEHARQQSGDHAPQPPSHPKKQGAVRQALRAATKTKTDPTPSQDAPEPRFIPAPRPPAPQTANVPAQTSFSAAAQQPQVSPAAAGVQGIVSPQRNSIQHRAYTKNLGQAFPQTQPDAETIATRRRSLNVLICSRLVILAILGILEGAIIARYTTNMGWGFWLVITLYAIVQVWPLARPAKDASDASVYSVWGIFSLICFIGVGLVLSPITFLLLVLNWEGISLGLDPMIVLCTLGALWLLEIGLLSTTLYKFNTLRAVLARASLNSR